MTRAALARLVLTAVASVYACSGVSNGTVVGTDRQASRNHFLFAAAASRAGAHSQAGNSDAACRNPVCQGRLQQSSLSWPRDHHQALVTRKRSCCPRVDHCGAAVSPRRRDHWSASQRSPACSAAALAGWPASAAAARPGEDQQAGLALTAGGYLASQGRGEQQVSPWSGEDHPACERIATGSAPVSASWASSAVPSWPGQADSVDRRATPAAGGRVCQAAPDHPPA